MCMAHSLPGISKPARWDLEWSRIPISRKWGLGEDFVPNNYDMSVIDDFWSGCHDKWWRSDDPKIS